MTPTVSHLTPRAGGRAELLLRFRDWSGRFVAFADRPPTSTLVGHHVVWALVHEGIGLVAMAQKAGLPDGEIAAAVSDVRCLQRASPFVCRLQDWPRGYPGDFETIEYLCRQENRAAPGTAGWYVEGMVLNTMVAQQHRNKVVRQADLIADAVLRNPEARILVVACGGVPDVRRVLSLVERSRCRLVLNDMDPNALAFCRSHLDPLGDRANYVEGNALRVAPRVAGHGPFDLILCGGLFDYLDDRPAGLLLRTLVPLVRGGSEPGRLLFTNIAVGNPYRPWMEFFASWRLIERTAADLHALVAAAALSSACVAITTDPTGLTWLVEVAAGADQAAATLACCTATPTTT